LYLSLVAGVTLDRAYGLRKSYLRYGLRKSYLRYGLRKSYLRYGLRKSGLAIWTCAKKTVTHG